MRKIYNNDTFKRGVSLLQSGALRPSPAVLMVFDADGFKVKLLASFAFSDMVCNAYIDICARDDTIYGFCRLQMKEFKRNYFQVLNPEQGDFKNHCCLMVADSTGFFPSSGQDGSDVKRMK